MEHLPRKQHSLMFVAVVLWDHNTESLCVHHGILETCSELPEVTAYYIQRMGGAQSVDTQILSNVSRKGDDEISTHKGRLYPRQNPRLS